MKQTSIFIIFIAISLLLGQTYANIKVEDDSQMVLIPAGDFQMGDSFKEGNVNELPIHTVYLDAFYIDIHEVTNEQYANFLNEYVKGTDSAGHLLLDIDYELCLIMRDGNKYKPKAGYENHPVIMVSWYGAAAYAQFYGKRLPTEAEWEKAARGGLIGKRYPWGDLITHNDANYNGKADKDIWNSISPIGSFYPNDYGLYDVAGNVWEWCADEYSADYYSLSPRNNPKGPGTPLNFVESDFTKAKGNRVLRGGSFFNFIEDLRVSVRNYDIPTAMGNIYGFRCVQDAQDTGDVDQASVGVSNEKTKNKGSSFSAMINITGVTNLSGFQMDISFNPTILKAVEVQEGEFLSSSGETYWHEPTIDNSKGLITGIAGAKTTKGSVDGDGILAIVTFTAIAKGESYIRLQNVRLSDPNANLIPVTILEGSVTVIDYPSWDVNKDGIVDILDIVIVGQHFGEQITEATEPNPDVNKDGVVDILDIVLVGQHFGETYSPTAPARDLWKVSPEHLPLIIKLYEIMENGPSIDKGFITAKGILYRLICESKVTQTAIFQNYPNPFNPETWIPYQLSTDSDIVIRIYNTSGNLIKTLNLGRQSSGFYTTKENAAYWDGKNEAGEQVSSGIYFYNIQAGEFVATKKMVITR